MRNGSQNSDFLTMLTLMTVKLGEAEAECVELRAHIKADHEVMDEDQRTITDLRTQNARMYDIQEENYSLKSRMEDMKYRTENYDSVVRENQRLYAEVRQLQTEKLRRELNISPLATLEEAAHAYMLLKGAKVWTEGNKIACIKVCREVTGWGLKETKDFCENYMSQNLTVKETLDTFLGPKDEEVGSGTKRSEQLPKVGNG